MDDSAQIEVGPLICWWCGYDLNGVDLVRSNLKCPECGKDNVPGNGPEAPYLRRAWPRWWVLGLELLWPGVILGVVLPLGMADPGPMWLRTAQPAIGWAVFPAAMMCVVWAPMIATLIVEDRVPVSVRRRAMLGIAVGGIIANFALAAGVMGLTRLAGRSF